MAKNKIQSLGGLVYSTNPDFKLEEDSPGQIETALPAAQPLRVSLDKKQRAGKAVTLITGFIGGDSDLGELGKKIKTFCGTGGSVKMGEIIVQGDNREKALLWLQKNGYKLSKKIG